MTAEKFTANQYFNSRTGITIFNSSGTITISINGVSSSEIADTARAILSKLNTPYYERKAYLEQNEQNYEWGLITKEMRDQRIEEIESAYKG
jgi:hypothetical protein